MSSPPRTPTSPRHHRRPSSISISSGRHSLSRRSSAAYSPVLSRLGSSHGYGGNLAEEFAELNSGGMGSLADELGGWDEDEIDEEGESFAEGGIVEAGAERDSGIDVASSPPPEKRARHGTDDSHATSLLNPETANSNPAHAHNRKPSDYDGSEYGSESDFETSELISASLEARMAAVEALARRGLEENGSDADATIARFTAALADLGGQAGIETGVTRLTTAHTSLSTHLTHQTRHLQQTTSTLLSPLAPPLPAETASELPDAISATLTLLAGIQPSAAPPAALRSLAGQTAELAGSLATVADTLQMNRQATLTAARRLRAARALVADLGREAAERDRAVAWLQRGAWDRRLAAREAKAVCDEVLSGFERVCDRWRGCVVSGGLAGGGGVEVVG